jgi:3-deoxy-7-phosphoheptulonate synthase / chorismate mutase
LTFRYLWGEDGVSAMQQPPSHTIDAASMPALCVCTERNRFSSLAAAFGLSTSAPLVIAGPCSVEDPDMLDTVAQALARNGVRFLRGGAFKPRTSPYDFAGLGEQGLSILRDVGRKYGLATVSEVLDTRQVAVVGDYVDVLQVGSRNMQNYELLKEVGRSKKPVLLKRGMSATLREFLCAAEYVALGGATTIAMCERGIRTFETCVRNTLDLSIVPILKQETSLSVIVDVSHSLGRKDIVVPIARAALAAGADGIMVEVHPHPERALSDGVQQLTLEELEQLMRALGGGSLPQLARP